MTLEHDLNDYEVLPSEPPETRPRATKAWKELKILATTAVMAEVDRYIRRLNRTNFISLRKRDNRVVPPNTVGMKGKK